MLHLVWTFWRRDVSLVVKNQTTVPQLSSLWLMWYPSACCHGINHKYVTFALNSCSIFCYMHCNLNVVLYTLSTLHIPGIVGWSIHLTWGGCCHLHHHSSLAWISEICSYSIPSPLIQAWHKASNLVTGEAEGSIQVSEYFLKKAEKCQYEVNIGGHLEHLPYASEIDIESAGYPLHSPVSPSLPLPCVTVCRQVSNALYHSWDFWVGVWPGKTV